MAEHWNPNSPDTAGLEFPIIRSGYEPISSALELITTAPAITVGTATAPVTYFPQLVAQGGQISAGSQPIVCTLYDALDDVTRVTDLQRTFLAVSGGAGGVLQGAATYTDALAVVSDNKLVYVDSGGTDISLSFGTSSTLFNGRRILHLILHYSLFQTDQSAAGRFIQDGQVLLALTTAAPAVDEAYGTLLFDSGGGYIRSCDMGEAGPSATAYVWSPSSIHSLRSGSTRKILFLTPSTPADIRYSFDYVALEVVHCEENRIGAGIAFFDDQEAQIAGITVYDVRNETFIVDLAATGDRVLSYRQVAAPGPWNSFASPITWGGPVVFYPFGPPRSMPWIEAPDLPQLVQSYRAPVSADHYVTALGEPQKRIYGCGITDGSDFTYHECSTYTELQTAQVFTDPIGTYPGTASQELELNASKIYTKLRFLAKRVGAPPDLEVRNSTTVVATLTETMFDTMSVVGGGWSHIQLDLTSPITATGFARLDFTKVDAQSAGDAGNTWLLAAAFAATGDPRGSYGTATYRGRYSDTTNSLPDGELYALLSTDAPQVTGVGIALGAQAITAVTGCGLSSVACSCAERCVATSVNFVHLTWSTTVITGFERYEVERMTDCDDWQLVATLTESSIGAFDDYEMRLGVESTYRVRVCRLDGICGDWSAGVSFAPPTGATGLLWFTSNVEPGLALGYADVYGSRPEREYEFLDADEVVTQRLYGRDYQVVFRPTEVRGERFKRTLILHSCTQHPLPSIAVFTPLRTIAEAELPYVCVRDHEGNRWFASVTVPGGSERQRRSHVVTADITVTEITATPCPDEICPV